MSGIAEKFRGAPAGSAVLLDWDGTAVPQYSAGAELEGAVTRARAQLKLLTEVGIRAGVVSGKPVAMLRSLLGRPDHLILVGNYGLEIEIPWAGYSFTHPGAERLADQVMALTNEVRDYARGKLVRVEGKRLALFLSGQVDGAWFARLKIPAGMVKRVSHEGWYVEPCLSWDKGSAVAWLAAGQGTPVGPPPAGAVWLYAGNDETDVPALRALRAVIRYPNAVPVWVGNAPTTSETHRPVYDHRVKQAQVPALLDDIVSVFAGARRAVG